MEVSEEVYALYGLPDDSSFDAIFGNISDRLSLITKDQAQMTLTVKTVNGNVIEGLSVNGLLTNDGSTAKLNASGVATGYVTAGSRTLSISGGYADIAPISKTYTFVKGNTYSDTWTLQTVNFLRKTSSGSVKFSANCETIDFSIVGGGGSGGAGDSSNEDDRYTVAWGGGGGGGGYSTIKYGINVTPDTSYSVSIAGSGGTTTFMNASASGGSNGSSGGSAGSGNGTGGSGSKGGDASAGSAGSNTYFTSYTETGTCGGGGGGGGGTYDLHGYPPDNVYSGKSGGSPFGGGGGNGAYGLGSPNNAGSSGSIPGGGGGGGGGYSYQSSGRGGGYGGAGGSGILTIRMHLKVT